MRVGDFGVEIVAVRGGEVREIESGHVLARPGTVYGVRLRNHGPLRCIAEVRVDGKAVTGPGVVLNAYGVMTLERPVTDGETGRFTVIAEGDERVFGPDGGRDNERLGEIEVRFRRELPRHSEERVPDFTRVPAMPHPIDPSPSIPTPPGRRMAPPEWTPPGIHMSASRVSDTPARRRVDLDLIERAAGTGLTGHSAQEFESIAIGPLENEATIIRLRIVIGSDEAFNEPRPLRDEDAAPARPPARP